MDIETIKAAAGEIRWHHKIDFGNGFITPGNVDTQKKLKGLGLPEDLRSKTVLDIGAWDGFYSFEAEKRGAKRVVATDHFCWGGEGPGTKAGFDLAHRVLRSKVEAQELDVFELSAESIGTFDIVLFLGVLYHMRHPMLSLERVADVTAPGGIAIIETHVDMLPLKRPALAFYPERELAGDPTNWFGPNPAAMVGMLKASGFKKVNMHTPALNPERYNSDPEVIEQHRMVFHAFKY